MARLAGEHYDAARKLFKPRCADGAPRCQCFGKAKLKTLRAIYGADLSIIEVIDLADAQCGAHARGGSTACFHHGAGSVDKPGGRPLVHGRFSKDMPKNLLARFEHALEDTELLQLRAEMALVVALISDTLKQYGDFAPDLEELGDAMTALGQAIQAGDLTEAETNYLTMYEVFKASKGQWAVLHELEKLIEVRRKLSGSEVRRLEALKQMLTVQQAMAFQASVLFIVTELLNKVEALTCPKCQNPLSETYEVAQMRYEMVEEFRKLSTRTTRAVLDGGAG